MTELWLLWLLYVLAVYEASLVEAAVASVTVGVAAASVTLIVWWIGAFFAHLYLTKALNTQLARWRWFSEPCLKVGLQFVAAFCKDKGHSTSTCNC